MFITALFIIARTGKQPRCPSADEWIRKLWYIYKMEYYSVIKKNKIMQFATAWIELEIVILSEVRQTEKGKCHEITCVQKKNDTNEFIYKIETDSQT